MECFCCKHELQGMKCRFCGFEYIAAMSNQVKAEIDKQNEARAAAYRTQLIDRLTDFSVTVYEATRKDLEWSSKQVKFKIADGKDCDGKTAVFSDELGFNADSGGELAITYSLDKENRNQNVSIKKPSNVKGKLGLRIERDFSLGVFLGKDKVGTAELSLQ